MAYFDNAATTYPKPESVYDFMNDFYRNAGGSVGRGDYKIARQASDITEETRALLKGLFHCPQKQVVFTPTATIALNMIIQGIIQSGKRNIYISPFEHNAVTRILHKYKEDGIVKIFTLAVNQDLEYDLEKIRYQFDEVNPEFVIVSHASNVIGLISPVDDIFQLAKKYGSVSLVDMAQTAGLVDCNLGMDYFDFCVFAGHKTLYAPTGISGFIMNPELDFPSVIFGGTGYDSANQNMPERVPEKYEMGTLNILGIAGLNASLKWLNEIGIEKVREKEEHNRRKLISLLQQYDFIKIVGNKKNREYVGIVSILIDEISSDIASSLFMEKGISVRGGLQCAPLAHKFLKTYPAGTVRFSVSYNTTENDFNELKECLEWIEENI